MAWRKSSYSNPEGGACGEAAAHLAAVVPVRDSKHPRGPVLAFPGPGWMAFLSAVKGDPLGA